MGRAIPSHLPPLIALLLIAAPSFAADPKPPPAAALKTATYDLSDLINTNRPDDQPDPTPAMLTADMPIGAPSASRSDSRKSLASMFRETIDPKSWQPTGPATLTVDNNNFVISQTAENHRGIARMLRQLRENPEGRKPSNAFATAPRLPKDTRFDHTELALAVADIAKAANVPIDLNYKSLATFDVEPDAPVTADVSGQTPDHAVRTVIRAAANGRDLPVQTGTTKASITVSLDTAKDDRGQSRLYDIRQLPARAAGLDPKQPHPRKDVIDALVQRVQKGCKLTAVRETSGFLIVTASRKAHLEVIRFSTTSTTTRCTLRTSSNNFPPTATSSTRRLCRDERSVRILHRVTYTRASIWLSLNRSIVKHYSCLSPSSITAWPTFARFKKPSKPSASPPTSSPPRARSKRPKKSSSPA
jgi:hypothetical protein